MKSAGLRFFSDTFAATPLSPLFFVFSLRRQKARFGSLQGCFEHCAALRF